MKTITNKQIDDMMARFFERYPEVKEFKLSDFDIEDGILYPKQTSYLYEYLRGDSAEIIARSIGKSDRTGVVPYLTNAKTMVYMTSAIEFGSYGMLLFIQPWLREYFKKKGDTI